MALVTSVPKPLINIDNYLIWTFYIYATNNIYLFIVSWQTGNEQFTLAWVVDDDPRPAALTFLHFPSSRIWSADL